MESSEHNWANISETICPKLLIFGEQASWTLFFQNSSTNPIISQISFSMTSHFGTLCLLARVENTIIFFKHRLGGASCKPSFYSIFCCFAQTAQAVHADFEELMHCMCKSYRKQKNCKSQVYIKHHPKWNLNNIMAFSTLANQGTFKNVTML